MREQFHTATILPLHLEPFIQGVLNEKNFKPNYAVRNLISQYSTTRQSEASVYADLDKVIQLAKIIDRHAKFFFDYRKGQAPASVYYLTIAGHFIARHPEVFPNLPEDYADLARDYKKIQEDITQFESPRISPVAKFCYQLETCSALQDFLDHLRQGRADLSTLDVKEIYHRDVSPAYALSGNHNTLSIEISNLIKKINFVMNYHDNDFCDFISIGMKGNDGHFGRAELFHMLPRLTEGARNVFDICYSAFSEQYETEGHDFFYDFAEKIIAPANLLHMLKPDINPLCLDYLMAYATVTSCEGPGLSSKFGPDIELLIKASISENAEDEIFDHYNISKDDILAMSACLAISDITYNSMKLGGPKVISLYDGDDVVELYDKLAASTDFEIRDASLQQIWSQCRTTAAGHIREFSEQFPNAAEELGLQPAIF